LIIAVPTAGNGGLNDLVSPHFGRAPTFTIFNTKTQEVKILWNQSQHMGGKGYPPEHLAPMGVKAMVCAGLGWRAIQQFEQFGIKVFIGASPTNTAETAIQAYQSDKLQMATNENACREHQFRRH